MKKSMQKRIFLVFITLITVGIVMTGMISLALNKLLPLSFNQTNSLETVFIRNEAIAVLTSLVISFLLGSRYIRKVTEPIRQLSQITKKISHGDYFGQRIYAKTDDELDELSQNFNLMSIRLENTINELKENTTKLETVLRSMSNGVIAIDNNNSILIANPKVKEILGIKDENPLGKHIMEVFRNDTLNKAIAELSIQNDNLKFEMETKTPLYKICSVQCSIMKHQSDPNRYIGAVIIVQDITDIRRLENMRRDFVANVSHELKTPLTSIKGFVETLRAGAAENPAIREKFLNIIDIEADRLSCLIQDLLMLSEIENQEKEGHQETIDIKATTENIVNLLKDAADKKNIKINLEIDEKANCLLGKKSWYQQMMINLIDNSIKYTGKEGEIFISIAKDSSNLIIRVKDNGIGIPEEHLDRLFERFYRVDKARSSQVGGTGLGLAIVKHIVLSFRGSIKVNSEEGVGTEFIVQIPDKN